MKLLKICILTFGAILNFQFSFAQLSVVPNQLFMTGKVPVAGNTCPGGRIEFREGGKFCCYDKEITECYKIIPPGTFADEDDLDDRRLDVCGSVTCKLGESCVKGKCTPPKNDEDEEDRIFGTRRCLGGEHVVQDGRIFCCRKGRCRLVLGGAPNAFNPRDEDVAGDEMDEMDDEGNDEEEDRIFFGTRRCLGGEHVVQGGKIYCCRFGRCRLVLGAAPNVFNPTEVGANQIPHAGGLTPNIAGGRLFPNVGL